MLNTLYFMLFTGSRPIKRIFKVVYRILLVLGVKQNKKLGQLISRLKFFCKIIGNNKVLNLY